MFLWGVLFGSSIIFLNGVIGSRELRPTNLLGLLTSLGRLSYSVYLIHLPFLALMAPTVLRLNLGLTGT